MEWLPCTALSLAVNAAFMLAAACVAKKERIDLPFTSRTALLMLSLGTAGQCIAAAQSREFLGALVLVVALGAAIVSAATDALSGYVFDAVTLPALGAALVLAACAHAGVSAFAGAALCGGLLLLLFGLTHGAGLGLGDVKLALGIGAALGAKDGFAALGLAFIAGGSYAAFLLLTRRASRGDVLRFAPYLAAGMLTVSLYRTSA